MDDNLGSLADIFDAYIDDVDGSTDQHRCTLMEDAAELNNMPEMSYGAAIFTIEKMDGKWVGHNGEYGSYISFCPFCGKKLE